MIQILISALLVLVLTVVFGRLFKAVLNNNPTSVRACFGRWFLIEAVFEKQDQRNTH